MQSIGWATSRSLRLGEPCGLWQLAQSSATGGCSKVCGPRTAWWQLVQLFRPAGELRGVAAMRIVAARAESAPSCTGWCEDHAQARLDILVAGHAQRGDRILDQDAALGFGDDFRRVHSVAVPALDCSQRVVAGGPDHDAWRRPGGTTCSCAAAGFPGSVSALARCSSGGAMAARAIDAGVDAARVPGRLFVVTFEACLDPAGAGAAPGRARRPKSTASAG